MKFIEITVPILFLKKTIHEKIPPKAINTARKKIFTRPFLFRILTKKNHT